MVTHCHTSWSVFLRSLGMTCACAESLSITNIINQTYSPIPGTCCRQDTSGLVVLDLPTLAGLCIQIYAYRCAIHARNESCRTSPSSLPCRALEKKVVSCPVSYRLRQEQVCMYMRYLILNLPGHFRFLPLSFQFPFPFQFSFF